MTAGLYMLWEAQWLRCREENLSVPGLSPGLKGLRILHLSDVHLGQPGLNLRCLRKAVKWAQEERPDLVLLTGDILGGRFDGSKGLQLLGSLRPALGKFAVTGNHEYGLSKNPFAPRPREFDWAAAGITLLRDECLTLHHQGEVLTICGADYVTGGHGLDPGNPDGLSVLLIHRPPKPEDSLAGRFDLAFAGHTHGGQIRIPTPHGLFAPHRDGLPYLEGVHSWGKGRLILSRGVGTTFLPIRLLTRPEAVIYRLTEPQTGRGVI